MNKCRYWLSATAAVATLLPASDVGAEEYVAPVASSVGRATLLEPFAFINVEDLNFGSYIVPQTGSMTITVDATDGTVTKTGDVTEITNSAPQRGRFIGAGDPDEPVKIEAVLPDKLYKNGDDTLASIDVTMSLDLDPEVDGTYAYQVRSNRLLDVYVGGEITIDSTQEVGHYENTFTVTATYQ